MVEQVATENTRNPPPLSLSLSLSRIWLQVKLDY
jgi:hypothetical protein